MRPPSARAAPPRARLQARGVQSGARSSAPMADEARTGRTQVAAGDRLHLDGAERVAEVPAVEPRAAHRGAELEVRLERGDDLFERVEVMKMLVDQLSRGLLLRLAERSTPL